MSLFPPIVVMTLALLSFVPAAQAHGTQAAPADMASVEQKPFGIAGDPRKATRTIKVSMSDRMRFTPNSITVRQGETVKFVVTNRGKVLHEMVIGTMADFKEHAALMKKFPGMEHDEPHMAHVRPGKTGEIAWTFNEPGHFNFACLIAGHFESGMQGKITVLPAKDSKQESK